MAAEEDVVERRPRPARRWTQSNPLTPPARSPPLVSPSELKSELVELGVPTVGGFSILYLRNSEKYDADIIINPSFYPIRMDVDHQYLKPEYHLQD